MLKVKHSPFVMIGEVRQNWLAIGLLSTALSSSGVAAPLKTPALAETKQLVGVDGPRRLYMDCIGHGEPTIVFDTGYATVGANWRPVQMLLGQHNRACAYDRAGMAYSDPPSRPTIPTNVVDDLHRLIRASDIKTPFVLVGHSRGGLYATLYALTYKTDVAAMVLVDPAFAQYNAENRAISASEREYIAANARKHRADFVRCEGLAKANILSKSDPHDCFSAPVSEPPAVREAELYQGTKSGYYGALISEFDSSLADMDNAKITDPEQASAHPLGDLPLVVLTSGKPWQTWSNPSDNAAADAVWKHGHDRLAAYSSKGRSVVVPNSSHMIQVDDPAAVADAVRTVLHECCETK